MSEILVGFILVATALDYVLDAVLVGLLFGLLLMRMTAPPSTRIIVGCLVLGFALLDNYWWPAVLMLDVTFTIGNEEVARLLGFGRNEPVEDLLSLGFFDLTVWFVQSWIAVSVAYRLADSYRDSANPPVQADRAMRGG